MAPRRAAATTAVAAAATQTTQTQTPASQRGRSAAASRATSSRRTATPATASRSRGRGAQSQHAADDGAGVGGLYTGRDPDPEWLPPGQEAGDDDDDGQLSEHAVRGLRGALRTPGQRGGTPPRRLTLGFIDFPGAADPDVSAVLHLPSLAPLVIPSPAHIHARASRLTSSAAKLTTSAVAAGRRRTSAVSRRVRSDLAKGGWTAVQTVLLCVAACVLFAAGAALAVYLMSAAAPRAVRIYSSSSSPVSAASSSSLYNAASAATGSAGVGAVGATTSSSSALGALLAAIWGAPASTLSTLRAASDDAAAAASFSSLGPSSSSSYAAAAPPPLSLGDVQGMIARALAAHSSSSGGEGAASSSSAAAADAISAAAAAASARAARLEESLHALNGRQLQLESSLAAVQLQLESTLSSVVALNASLETMARTHAASQVEVAARLDTLSTASDASSAALKQVEVGLKQVEIGGAAHASLLRLTTNALNDELADVRGSVRNMSDAMGALRNASYAAADRVSALEDDARVDSAQHVEAERELGARLLDLSESFKETRAKAFGAATMDDWNALRITAEARATKTDLAALQVEVGERAGRAEVAALQIEVRTVRETASSAVETSTSALAEAGAAASLAASSRTAAEDAATLVLSLTSEVGKMKEESATAAAAAAGGVVGVEFEAEAAALAARLRALELQLESVDTITPFLVSAGASLARVDAIEDAIIALDAEVGQIKGDVARAMKAWRKSAALGVSSEVEVEGASWTPPLGEVADEVDDGGSSEAEAGDDAVLTSAELLAALQPLLRAREARAAIAARNVSSSALSPGTAAGDAFTSAAAGAAAPESSAPHEATSTSVGGAVIADAAAAAAADNDRISRMATELAAVEGYLVAVLDSLGWREHSTALHDLSFSPSQVEVGRDLSWLGAVNGTQLQLRLQQQQPSSDAAAAPNFNFSAGSLRVLLPSGVTAPSASLRTVDVSSSSGGGGTGDETAAGSFVDGYAIPTSTSNIGEKFARVADVLSIVNSALAVYAADGVGMPDFASATAGAAVLARPDLTTSTWKHAPTSPWRQSLPSRGPNATSLLTLPRVPSGPLTALQRDTSPGSCWAMAGHAGSLGILLTTPIKITAVTIDHSPPGLAQRGSLGPGGAPSASTAALRRFSLFGLSSPTPDYRVHLGTFTYDAAGPGTQTFFLPARSRAKDDTFPAVQVEVHSNWGNTEYTCIYRVRVHGYVAGHVNSGVPTGPSITNFNLNTGSSPGSSSNFNLVQESL